MSDIIQFAIRQKAARQAQERQGVLDVQAQSNAAYKKVLDAINNNVDVEVAIRNAPGLLSEHADLARSVAKGKKKEEARGQISDAAATGPSPQAAPGIRQLGPLQGPGEVSGRPAQDLTVPQFNPPLQGIVNQFSDPETLRMAEIQSALAERRRAGVLPEQVGAERIAERAAVRGERRGLAAAGRPQFVKDAAVAMATGGATQEQVRSNAIVQFGEENANIIMSQIGMNAISQIASGSANPKQFYIDDGADPIKAHLAVNKQAFKDPLTELYIRGPLGGVTSKQASANKAMMESIAILKEVAEKATFAGVGGLFSGSIADFQATIGPDAPPELTEFIVASQWAVTNIAYALSGAQYAEEFLDRIAKLVPTFGELQLKNGKLAPSMVSRMKTLSRLVESNHLSLLDHADRKPARTAIESFRNLIRQEMNSPEVLGAISTRDPEGSELLNRLETKARAAGTLEAPGPVLRQ